MKTLRHLLLLLTLWGAVHPARAATYDPDLTWRTLRTEHFDIHFHQGIEQVADEFSVVVEDVYATMIGELRWKPRPRTHVVLVDRTDAANGFARAIPYPAITIYVTAPTDDSSLQLYEDWSEAIFTHELTHVLHMDTNHGIVRAARLVVGRVASTNSLSPAWMIEGFATFQETRQTNGGRGRAAIPSMIKRTAVLEDDFPPLGNLDGFQPDPPGGNLRYLFGQDFIDYVAETRGEDVWTRWIHLYGGRIPFFLPNKKAFGSELVPLYYAWRDHLTAKSLQTAEAVRAEGETVARIASNPGASCVAPTFSPDGERLVWSCYDLRLGAQIWMADGDGYGAEILLQDRGAVSFTWRADSNAFVYAAVHLVNQFNYWSDIYMHVIDGSTSQLTNGARARDPDFSPDGSKLLYVTNRAQNNQLEVMTVDRRRNTLTDHTDHTQYSSPRYSPDGRAIAVSVWRDGRRDLWLYSPEGNPVRRLTADTAIDSDATWSADGKWLYFSSDRTGIPNIYAIDIEAERLWQVTNVVTGAFRPSLRPDGKLLAFMQYSKDGWDVGLLDVDPSRFLDRGLLPAQVTYGEPLSALVGPADPAPVVSLWVPGEEGLRAKSFIGGRAKVAANPQTEEVVLTFEDTTVEDAFGEEKEYPFRISPRRYNPLHTLFPRYILPSLRLTPYAPLDPWQFTCIDEELLCPSLLVALSTSASDPLAHYGLGAAITYRTDANYVGGAFNFVINRFLPVVSFGVSTQAASTGRLPLVDPDAPFDEQGNLVVDTDSFYWEKRSTAAATVSFPYRLRTTVFAQYSFSDRRPLDAVWGKIESREDLGLPPNTVTELLPLIGTIGEVSGGWRFAFSEPTPYAISAEDGQVFSLVGSLLAPWLGTYVRDLDTFELEPFTQVQLTSEVRRYFTNPWIANHVLATRAAGGVTFGASQFLGNYQLGGSIGDGAFTIAPDEFRMIRGYPFAVDIGDMYWLGSLEYRFPLWRVERGVGTFPLYARTLSGAVFVDAGNAFNDPQIVTGIPSTPEDIWAAAIEDPLVGVGAELVIRVVVGYRIGLQIRLGYGVGLTPEGLKPGLAQPLTPAYAHFGGSF